MHLIKKISNLGLLVFVLFMLAGCFGTYEVKDPTGQSMMNSAGVYTLVNLHPDMERSRLYAVNYQLGNLMPLCTEVVLLKASKKVMVFKVKGTGQEFSYYYHKAAREPLMNHLTHFFGRECKTSKVKSLSAVDQKGIKQGVALKGMTREGVVFAMGIPPRHKTPSLDADSWKYWVNRFGTMQVKFDKKGLVSQIIR